MGMGEARGLFWIIGLFVNTSSLLIHDTYSAIEWHTLYKKHSHITLHLADNALSRSLL